MTTPRESLTPGDPVQPLYLLIRCASCMGKTEHKADSRGLYWCTQCPASRSAPAAISPPSTTVAAAIVELEAARPAGGGNGVDATEVCDFCHAPQTEAALEEYNGGHGYTGLKCSDHILCSVRAAAKPRAPTAPAVVDAHSAARADLARELIDIANDHESPGSALVAVLQRCNLAEMGRVLTTPAVEAPACLPGDVPPEVVQHPGYATALRARIGELEAECAEWRVRALKAEDRLARAVVILMSPTTGEQKP